MDINNLFQNAYKKGREVQEVEHSGKEIDGRAIWQELEKTVEKLNISEMKYNDSLEKVYKKIDKIDKQFNMSNNETNPKSNHFLLQLRNLVKKKSNFIIKINRILQLGFNAGQLSIYIEKNTLPIDRAKKIKKLFKKYKLDKLETYVDLQKQKQINEQINEQINTQINQNGGYNYYQKYLKYKNKYLQLKQDLFGGHKND